MRRVMFTLLTAISIIGASASFASADSKVWIYNYPQLADCTAAGAALVSGGQASAYDCVPGTGSWALWAEF
ncbi:hypothetical protein D0T12_00345 [Actinomadura spongiicola]|uniref:Uncharacterized protein n=2 Tax=Actinomadura spongiicola TaxID=2303421 RepID=A0A372GN10_9ACTN|nr:hypothetical protein D0T12_00345 [Actinomadura spongiicola]